MGWEPGSGVGRGEVPGAGQPGVPARDSRLAGFARDEEWDACPPSAVLAAALEGASGRDWRCPGATRDEMAGLLRRWAALEAWAAAGRLGVLRALIRDDDQPLPGGGHHGDLPDGWSKSLTYEVAAALAVSVPTAEAMMWLAWDLEARMPGVAGLLADGVLTYSKARAVDDAFQLLRDEDVARAETMILANLPGKNYGQAKRLAEQAAVTVDPGAAARRREDAERNKARVTMFREDSGALGLSGRDLPADETLAAHARVCARAQEYKESRAFPGDTRMDQFRAAAYVDLLNGTPAGSRIAAGMLPGTRPADDTVSVGADVSPVREENDGDGTRQPPESHGSAEGAAGLGKSSAQSGDALADMPDADRDGERGPGNEGPEGNGGTGNGDSPQGSPGAGGAGTSLEPKASERPPRLTDLVVPLVTLLGLTGRPGEAHGLGPLDPELCRALAASAAASPFSRLCVTVTDSDGIAIGHGCARPTGGSEPMAKDRGGCADGPVQDESPGAVPGGTLALLPARVNLTIPASCLAQLAALTAAPSPPRQAPWTFTSVHDQGPPGGFGTRVLTPPGGSRFGVRLAAVPTFSCDHRHESRSYQPNDTLRHLVQVRDGECTFPVCSRHARETDFEHAVPYDKGGRTCACNAGARSRQCHRVKQSKGWQVTQPKPGWHQWQTPAGRVYTQGPKRYPD